MDSNYTIDEYGIPTSLMQVAFTSSTLTSAEHNYPNIKREIVLGVVFGVEHFKHFTLGNEVCMITDHKSLVSLLKKSIVVCSSRLSRLMLKIVDFPLKFLYQPGRKMVISDALSSVSSHQTPDTKEMVSGLNGIANSSTTTTSNKTTTHSGRVIKPPTKLNLYPFICQG